MWVFGIAILVLGPQLQFTKKAKKLTKMTDPISASARGIGILFNYCFGNVGAVHKVINLSGGDLLSRTYGSSDSYSPDTEIAMSDKQELKECAQRLLVDLQE